MSNVFLKRGITYTPTEGNFSALPVLDEGIYRIVQDPINGSLFLVRIADNFHFGFKLYGIDDVLVKHVIDTYQKQPTKRNIGVLLNGAKGTGKTVTAKVMANKLGLPVILCDRPYPGLSNFLASINHDCIFFFDEFEKSFRMRDDDGDNTGESLLTIMDGVYNADHCHIFILTTNELRINDNLISRPSRIRYLKSFGEVIDKKILEEFVDDALEDSSRKEEIMDFVDTLTMATIDIVKSIVEEVNIHGCSVDEFKRFFNVREASYRYFCKEWYYDDSSEYGLTKESFLKQVKIPNGTSAEWKPNLGSLTLNKSIKKLNIGDFITNRYKVEEIDLSKNYILVSDVRYRGGYKHVWIEDIDVQPNLYVDSAVYAYDRGCNEDFW